jgi:hypothetical protein
LWPAVGTAASPNAWLLVLIASGELACAQAGLKLQEKEPLPDPIRDKPRIADKAYASADHPELKTPHKKPKGES